MELPAAEPRIFILHGDDAYAIEQTVTAWVRELGDETAAEMNLARLDGRGLNENALRNATDALPFLASRRLVILTNPFPSSAGGKGPDPNRTARLLNQLARIPETTRVALLIEDSRSWRGDWEVLGRLKTVGKWVDDHRGLAQILAFPLPRAEEMPGWIVRCAAERGGKIKMPAAVELFQLVGSDTQIAAQEIDKLLTYVNRARAVERDDVQLLVSQTAQVDVFELMDAIGSRKTTQALRLLDRMLEDSEIGPLLGMVTRQFRLLLLVREVIAERGGPDQVVAVLGGEPFRVNSKFMANKLFNQARAFSLEQLKSIYRQLPALHEETRSSAAGPKAALTAFIVGLSER